MTMLIDRLNHLRVRVVHLLGGEMRYGLPFYGRWSVWLMHRRLRKQDTEVLKRYLDDDSVVYDEKGKAIGVRGERGPS